MARISKDGTHTAITAAPGWKSEDELEKQYQDTYNTGGTGPTADQINAAYAQNTQKTQNLESSEKNLNYSGKYKNAKKEIVIQACQSWIDLQSTVEANWAVLEEMEKDNIEYPSAERERQHDELLRTTEKQEQALPFYEKVFWDRYAEYLDLYDEEEQANQTYWKDYEDWEKDQNFFTRIVSDYQGNDMELLSEDALVYLESFQEGCWQYTEKEIDRRLEEIQQEKDGLHSYHSEVALLGSGGVSSLMEKQKMLENEEAALRTEKYQLEGVKTRFRQKCEAVRDPDFLRYVEQGQARESSAYDTAVFGSALNAMMGSEYSVPNNTDPFEDTKAMDPMDKKMYYYFLGKDPDSQAAVEYQNSQQRQINKRRNDEYLERIQKGAEENPFGYGISSGIPNFYGAFMTVGDILAERARYGGEDLLADPNTPGQRMLKGVQAGREPGLEGIENPGLKKAARYGYAFMDSSPAYLLNWLGAPGAGAAYMGILRGAQGYTAAANQGMTMEDALQEGKAKGALGMFLTNRAFQNTRNAQGGGFSRKPGNMAGQEASSGLMVPALPGASPEAGAHALINQLGTQGAFQYLMESNGYSMGNVLARPSAEQAYAILKSANLSPKAIQVLLEDNGYPSDIVFKSSSLSPEHGSSAYHTLSNILEESGLQPDEIQSLLRDKGYSLDEEKAQSVVHNALQSAGLSPQEIQNVMENRDHSFQKPFGSLPASAAGGNSNYPADSGMLAGTNQNRKGNLDLSKSTGYSQEEASLRVAAEKAYAALQSAGLSPQAIQNIMENNGNSLQKLFESAGVDYDSISNILKGTERKQMGPQTLPEKNRDFLKGGRTQPAAEKAYAALRSAGLSPREIQNLLGNNGHSFQKILDFPASTSGNNSLSHSAVSRMPEKAGFQLNDPQYSLKDNKYLENRVKYINPQKGNDFEEVVRLKERDYPNYVNRALGFKSDKINNQAFPLRFEEEVVIFPPIKGDAITHRSLYNELRKSSIGKETIDYILNGKCKIEISYTDEAPERVLGESYGYNIFIFARNTKTVKTTASTIIHEVTHSKYDIGGDQWSEAVCFAREFIHRNGRLTTRDKRDIIKLVKKLYPEYKWHKGGTK